MDNEIGTYSMILSKTQFGKSGSECPTKTIILAMNELIAVDNASTYGSLECVRIRDVRRKTVEWNYYLSVSPTSISADAGNSMHTIRITSYKKRVVDGVEESAQTAVSWDYDWNANWISPSGSPTSTSVSFYTNENTTTSTRRDNVIITQAESGKTATVSVVQDAGDVSDNYYLEVDPTSMSFGASGGTKSYTVSSYKKQVINGVEQSGSTDVGWSANVTGSGFSYTSTDVTASANSGSARTGTLKITQDESKYWEEISLSQDAQAISYDFVVSDWQKSVAAAGGTTDAITITSTKTENGSTTNIGWSIDSSTLPSWLTWNASSMTFTATANTSTSSREQRIYFEQNESGNRDYAMVTQAGAAAPDNYVFTWSDGTTTQKSLTPDSAATTGSYDLVSTKNGSAHLWDVSSNVSWITTEKASSTRLSYSVTANTGSSRTGIITASQSESGKTLVIQIVQASGAVTPDVYVFTWSQGGTGDINSSQDDNPAVINGTIISTKNGANQGWSAVSNSTSWLTVEKHQGSTSNISFYINVARNTSTQSRSGIVTFTQEGSGKTLKVNVTQQGVAPTPTPIRFTIKNSETDQLYYEKEWPIPSSTTTKEIQVPALSVGDDVELTTSLVGDVGTGSWTGQHLIGDYSNFQNRLNSNMIESNRVSDLTFTVNWYFEGQRYVLEFNDGTTEKSTNVLSTASQELFGLRSTEFGVRSPITIAYSNTNDMFNIGIGKVDEDSTGKGYNVTVPIGANPNNTSRTGIVYITQTASQKEIQYKVNQYAKTPSLITITINNPQRKEVYPFSSTLDVEALLPGEFTPAAAWGSNSKIEIGYQFDEGVDVCADVRGGEDKAIVGNSIEFYTTEPFGQNTGYIYFVRIGSMTLTGEDQTVNVG